MATATPIPHSFDLDYIRERGVGIRRAVEEAGASDPRLVGEVAHGLTPCNNHVDFLVSSLPRLSLFTLVALERRLADLLDMSVSVWTEEGYRPEERARYVADAVPL